MDREDPDLGIILLTAADIRADRQAALRSINVLARDRPKVTGLHPITVAEDRPDIDPDKG